jgi:methionyl-tRNA formyltransferase
MPSVVLFLDGFVGKSIFDFLMNNPKYSPCIKGVVYSENYKDFTISDSVNSLPFSKGKESSLIDFIKTIRPDILILAWWPFILKKNLIELAKKGVINFHPSYLPYNRGKHYNFWTIIEDSPFGVTLHKINEGIDLGPILFQIRIEKTWEDTGESLYHKAQEAIISLFQENADNIFFGEWNEKEQNPKDGSFRWAYEMELASKINLDSSYTARELLNLLRARTFRPYPSCYFIENNEKYEVRVEIKKIQ